MYVAAVVSFFAHVRRRRFTTKAVVEMFECIATSKEGEPSGCESNPFYTIYPYLFIFISLALACISLYLLAVGLTKFEALYMITVFEGFMIISGAISGNVVMGEAQGQPGYVLLLYGVSIGVIIGGLVILCKGEQRPLLSDDEAHMLPARQGAHLRGRPAKEAASATAAGAEAGEAVEMGACDDVAVKTPDR
uniref:Uncharacterized protein n=1 Tax=Chrysotila carterae TaxID=13221 RepID=A0A7S4BS36_CHRCT